MNGGVSKARTRRSHVKLSKALQEKLLDAVANTGAGIHVDFLELGEMLTHQGQSFHQATKSNLRYKV